MVDLNMTTEQFQILVVENLEFIRVDLKKLESKIDYNSQRLDTIGLNLGLHSKMILPRMMNLRRS